MIAATAHAHGARLVTANVVDAGHLSELIEVVPLPRAQTPLNGEVCPILTLFSAPSKGGLLAVYWRSQDATCARCAALHPRRMRETAAERAKGDVAHT